MGRGDRRRSLKMMRANNKRRKKARIRARVEAAMKAGRHK